MANLPNRNSNAPTGSAFIEAIRNTPHSQEREDAIYQQIISGNFPNFLRNFVPITVSKNDITLTYYVMPDYLAIGSDTDYVRMPMSPLTAQKIATKFNCVLPTAKMVDQIWQNATTKLPPITKKNTSNLTSIYSYYLHNKEIEKHKPTGLSAGHKKDVIISNLRGNNAAIYGWHDKNGKPIQGLGFSHEETYADYSHGIRLIDNIVQIQDSEGIKKISLVEALKDKRYASLISNEGIIHNPSYNKENLQTKSIDMPPEKPAHMQNATVGPPAGYSRMHGQVPQRVAEYAKSLLGNPLGSEFNLIYNNTKYFVRIEPHYHKPPSQQDYEKASEQNIPITRLRPKPWGWHNGATVYVESSANTKTPSVNTIFNKTQKSFNTIQKSKSTEYQESSVDPKEQLLKKYEKFLDNIEKSI